MSSSLIEESATRQFGVKQTDWYAVSTRARHEKKVFQGLMQRDVESFLPLYRTVNRWRNGMKIEIELPLFQGYVFVRMNLRDRVRVLEVPGLVSLVGAGRKPIPLQEQEIETLRSEIANLRAEPHPFLKAGDRVVVKYGPLKGMVGVLVQRNSRSRLVISVDLIMQAIAVDIDEADIEPLTRRRGTIFQATSSC